MSAQAQHLEDELEYLLAVEKELCERSLAKFIQCSWHIIEPGTPLQWNWHLDTVCAYLEAVWRGDIMRLIINVPPGSMKSSVVSVGFPAWGWIHDASKRFLGISNEQGLSLRDAMKSKTIIESKWYQSRWPIEFNKRQNEKTLYQNTKFGHRQSIGIKANITGKRGDILLIDDANDTMKVESAPERQTVNDTYDLKISNRINDPEKSAIVQISQRSNVEDLTGHMLSKKETKWVQLIIPNEYEGTDAYDAGKDIGRPEFNDPRTEKGQLFFKTRFTPEVVRKAKEDLGSYGAAGQLQQRPTPKGGGIFKASYWKYYKTPPPDLTIIRMYADTAQKTKEQNDWSVFMVWAKSPSTGCIYAIDLLRGKWEAPDLERKAAIFWNKHKPTVHKPRGVQLMKVEDKVSGTGLVQTLRKAPHNIPVEPIQRNVDKVVRAIGAAPRVEAGFVYLPEDAPWVSDFTQECEQFTPLMTHKWDDQLDTMLDAIEDLLIFEAIDYGGAL